MEHFQTSGPEIIDPNPGNHDLLTVAPESQITEDPRLETEAILQELSVINLERHLHGLDALTEESIDESNPHHQEFLDSRLSLRSSQDKFIEEWQKESYLSDLPRQLRGDRSGSWEMVSGDFSPMSLMLLANFHDKSMNYSSPEPISIESLTKASRSVEGLFLVLDEVLAEQGRIRLNGIEELVKLKGVSETVKLVEKEAEISPVTVLNYSKKIVGAIGQENSQEIIGRTVDAVIADESSRINAYDLIAEESLSQMLNPEQIEGLVLKTTKESSAYTDLIWNHDPNVPNKTYMATLIESGKVTEAQVVDGIMSIVENDSFISERLWVSLEDYESLIHDSGKILEIQNIVADGVVDGRISFTGFSSINFFSSEEKNEITKQYIEKYPGRLSYNIPEISKLITPNELHEIFITHANELSYSDLLRCVELLPENTVSTEEKKTALRNSAQEHSDRIFVDIDVLIAILSDEAKDIINESLLNFSSSTASDAVASLKHWLPIMELNEQGQKDLVKSLILESNSMEFMREELFYDKKSFEVIASLLSKDELSELTQSTLETTSSIGILDVDRMIEFFGEDQVRSWAIMCFEKNPSTTLSILENSDIFTSEQTQNFILSLAESNPRALIKYFVKSTELIEKYLSKDERMGLLEKIIVMDPFDAAQNARRLFSEGAIDKSQMDKIYQYILEVNPIALLSHLETGYFSSEEEKPSMTAEEIMNAAKSSELTKFAPEWFNLFFDKVNRGSESNRSIWKSKAEVAFKNIASIRQKVTGDGFSAEKISTKSSDQLATLSKLAFLADNGSSEALGIAMAAESVEVIDNAVYQTIESLLRINIEGEGREQIRRSLDPFATYLSAFSGSPEHLSILSSIVSTSSEESYRDFRLGSEFDLPDLIANGLMPTNITADQHRQWREDVSIVRSEKLVMESEDVSKAIRAIIADNLSQMNFSPDLISAEPTKIDSDIARLGQDLARLRIEMKESLQSSPEKTQELTIALATVADELEKRQLLQLLRKVGDLKPEEIQSRSVIDEKGAKTQSVDNLLDRIKKLMSKRELDQKTQLSVTNIGQIIDSYTSLNEGVKNLSVEDTIDLQTTLEIGANPVGTCQNYATGVYRECLLGYTDPNTKIIVVREEGRIIARSIFRLLEDTKGDPALHVETIYSQSPSPIITDLILSFADQKAADMGGIPLFVSKVSQDAEGIEQQAKSTSGFKLTPTPDRLVARKTRAPLVYVDSSGGPRKGSYDLAGLQRVFPVSQ